MKKKYEAPMQEILFREPEHIFTMVSGGSVQEANIPGMEFDDIFQ